jgi:hypothetical protein
MTHVHERVAATIAAALAVAATTIAGAPLTLELTGPPGPYLIGELVTVTLSVRNLGPSPAAGFQAFLEFNAAKLDFQGAVYTREPFGLPVIDPVTARGNTLDVAAGIDQVAGQTPTLDDAPLVALVFEALENGCGAQDVAFRPHDPPTRLTDAFGMSLDPVLMDLPESDPDPDFDNNGVVNGFDLAMLLASWGPCDTSAECFADLFCDGVINGFDIAVLLAEWGPFP